MQPFGKLGDFQCNFNHKASTAMYSEGKQKEYSGSSKILEKKEILHDQQKDLQCFKVCFSQRDIAESLKKKNQNFEMLDFENSDQDPDQIYNRRNKKVSNLLEKQQVQSQSLMGLKSTDYGKYLTIIKFSKFVGSIKQNLNGIRTQYYSDKTFSALKNSSQEELTELISTLKGMYNNIINISKSNTGSDSVSISSEFETGRDYQFLIIPRFLISKQKIKRLIKDRQLQQNLEFLVIHQCLGHYNNEANKKMPEEKQMSQIRKLLSKKGGRQRFQKICSINHGNKLRKDHEELYFLLYTKSLDGLKYLENLLKKSKKKNKQKKLQELVKQFKRLPMETEDSISVSSNTDSWNSSIFSFGSIKDQLSKLEKECIIEVENKFRQRQFFEEYSNSPQKCKQGLKRGFFVKKSLTMEPKKTVNILLIKPPGSLQN